MCGLIGGVCTRASRSQVGRGRGGKHSSSSLLLFQPWESSVWVVQDLVLVHTRLVTFCGLENNFWLLCGSCCSTSWTQIWCQVTWDAAQAVECLLQRSRYSEMTHCFLQQYQACGYQKDPFSFSGSTSDSAFFTQRPTSFQPSPLLSGAPHSLWCWDPPWCWSFSARGRGRGRGRHGLPVSRA